MGIASAPAMTNLLAIIAAADEEASGGGLFSFALLPLMLLAMYFIIIRPNSKKRKQQMSLQSSLSVGDEVMTTSGMIGTITGEDGPDRFWLEIDDDVQIRIARGGIQGQFDAGDSTDKNDGSDDDVVDEATSAESADQD